MSPTSDDASYMSEAHAATYEVEPGAGAVLVALRESEITGGDWRALSDVELYGALHAQGMRPGDVAMMVAKRSTTLGEILLDHALPSAL